MEVHAGNKSDVGFIVGDETSVNGVSFKARFGQSVSSVVPNPLVLGVTSVRSVFEGREMGFDPSDSVDFVGVLVNKFPKIVMKKALCYVISFYDLI